MFGWVLNTPLGFESVRSEKNCQIVGRKILYQKSDIVMNLLDG